MSYSNIKFPENSHFLVTGGCGFIGSNLCEALLKKGYYVRCLDNLSTGKFDNIKDFLDNPKFEFVLGDIRDLETCMNACKGIDYVSHQAAWGSVPRSVAMPLLYEEINIRGTLNMFEAARQNKVKVMVYASSSSVYGDDDRLPKCEGHEGNVLSPYALTKRVDEFYGNLYYSLYGLKTIGFRYFNVFGRRQNPKGEYAAVIPKFIKMIKNDEIPTIFGDGQQSRDFTYIENVIEANLKGMANDGSAAGKAFNIAVGGRVYLNDLFNILCELLNKKMKPNYEPARVGDVKHGYADPSEAKKYLGFDAEWNFEYGISETVDWYLNKL